MRNSVLLRGTGAAVALAALLAGPGRAQTVTFNACYVPAVGAMYLITLTGLPAACLAASHVQVTWTERALAGTGAATTVARSDHTHALAFTANTGIGASALAANTGSSNTAVGTAALDVNTSGGSNTALGANALGANTTAGSNTAVGASALLNNTASDNTAVGAAALDANSSGASNTAVGANALGANTTAASNTAVGTNALNANTSGTGNAALGADALGVSVSGANNTAVGTGSLLTSTGTGNTALGAGAGNALTTGSDNIYIGNAGAATESATIRVGGAGQTRAFVAGIRGVTTGVADAIPVLIASNGQLGTVSSSLRFKEDIQDLGATSRGLLRLRPVSFRYIQPSADGAKPVQYGLIAEEVAEVYPELVVHGADGRPETVQYHVLPTLLLKELQRQETELVALRRALATQAALLEELRAEVRRDRR